DDPDDKTLFRFPSDQEDLERLVAQAIRHELDLLDAKIGYCSPGSGSEVLFGELLRQRGGELHLVIPFVLDDFYRMRVDYDLAELRKKAGVNPPPCAPQVSSSLSERQHKRQVQAMLFADVKNFSKLKEKWAPDFFLGFLRLVKNVLQKTQVPPLFSNTWGDG